MSKQASRHRSPASCWVIARSRAQPGVFTRSPLPTACQEAAASLLFWVSPTLLPEAPEAAWLGPERLSGRLCEARAQGRPSVCRGAGAGANSSGLAPWPEPEASRVPSGQRPGACRRTPGRALPRPVPVPLGFPGSPGTRPAASTPAVCPALPAAGAPPVLWAPAGSLSSGAPGLLLPPRTGSAPPLFQVPAASAHWCPRTGQLWPTPHASHLRPHGEPAACPARRLLPSGTGPPSVTLPASGPASGPAHPLLGLSPSRGPRRLLAPGHPSNPVPSARLLTSVLLQPHSCCPFKGPGGFSERCQPGGVTRGAEGLGIRWPGTRGAAVGQLRGPKEQLAAPPVRIQMSTWDTGQI